MDMAPGARLGHYEIVGPLGAGGMGEVYRARDTRLQRPAAIKIIGADATDPDRLKRLEREALAASALNHPNILTVYEFGESAGVHYIATELVAGETLRQRIAREPVPADDAIDIALQIATALDAAHAAGIVHRDIKPENVMVRPDGYVKVLDFGIAKVIPSAAAAGDTATLTGQTAPGMLIGTAGYMSPEQIRGLPVDRRSDIWSFGVVLQEMLTGRSPFSGRTMSDTIAAILERTPPALEKEAPEAAALQPVLDRALAKDENARYQSMTDAIADLRQIRRAPPRPQVVEPAAAPTAAPTPDGKPERRWAVPAAVGALVFVLTAVTAWMQWRDPSPSGATGTSTGAASTTQQVLRYSLVVHPVDAAGEPAGPELKSDGTDTFSRAARFAFQMRSERPGYVYLINDSRNADGNSVLTMMFPTPSIRAGSAAIGPDADLVTGRYIPDPNAPIEHVWIVWAAQPQSHLEEAARRFVNDRDFGRIRDLSLHASIQQLFTSRAAELTSQEPNPAARQMVLKTSGDLLVYRALLRTRADGGES